MKVYRVENYLGKGPYQYPRHGVKNRGAKVEAYASIHESHNDVAHPDIHSDILPAYFRSESHWCACLSVKDLGEWFEGFDEKLSAASFFIQAYEVDASDVFVGNSGRQVAFDRAKARKSGKKQPVNFTHLV